MLRKDTVYITKLHWEPKIPSKEIIDKQAKNKHAICDNVVRLFMGKAFIGKR